MALLDVSPVTCDRCRRPIPVDAPGGLCPNCLFAAQIIEHPSSITHKLSDTMDASGDAASADSGFSLEGTELGPYKILKEIGRGGMGVVYQARHEQLDRLVAIKMILAGNAAPPRQLHAFLTEARAAAQVRHPNIVGVYEVGQIRGSHFMAMELVEGKSLQEMVHAGPIEIEDAARIVRDTAAAMSYLHQHGIVHRDIKPSNILVDADGIPYVTDFGLAKIRELSTGLTTEGLLAGTPSYMSPEQATGAPEGVAPQTDVFSLGAVLYEILTGRPPFRGKSVPETLMQVVKREPDAPRSIRPEIPTNLDRICLKCLEKNPADRYADMATLSADLERFLDGEAVTANMVSAPQRIRRWWRRDPLLASRFLCLWLFFIIEQAWYFGLGATSFPFYLTTTIVVPLWAMASYVFTYVLRRARPLEESVRALWITADIIFLTGILLTSDGMQQSPLVMLFPIYIVSAGLWSRVTAVWLATVLCIFSNMVLWLYSPILRPERAEPLHVHVVFAACMLVLGILVSHHVRQVRTMRRYLRQQQPPST